MDNGVVASGAGINCTEDSAVDPDCLTTTPLPLVTSQKTLLSPASPKAGDAVNYQFVITNQGATAAATVPVADDLSEVLDDATYDNNANASSGSLKSGDQSVLNDNLWHRFLERSDPEKGGNFILAGHRFDIGFSPGETKRRSPLYHVDMTQPGDKLYADFNGKRYEYEITKRFSVKPTQTEIEAESSEPCTLKGEKDGREVLEAGLVRKKDVDPAMQL